MYTPPVTKCDMISIPRQHYTTWKPAYNGAICMRSSKAIVRPIGSEKINKPNCVWSLIFHVDEEPFPLGYRRAKLLHCSDIPNQLARYSTVQSERWPRWWVALRGAKIASLIGFELSVSDIFRTLWQPEYKVSWDWQRWTRRTGIWYR